MIVKLKAYGIARDILNGTNIQVEVKGSQLVGDVRQHLLSAYPGFGKLASLRFAVNADYVEDDHKLNEGDEVVLIPPVSGG